MTVLIIRSKKKIGKFQIIVLMQILQCVRTTLDWISINRYKFRYFSVHSSRLNALYSAYKLSMASHHKITLLFDLNFEYYYNNKSITLSQEFLIISYTSHFQSWVAYLLIMVSFDRFISDQVKNLDFSFVKKLYFFYNWSKDKYL